MLQNKYKKTIYKFCEEEIVSPHFARHLQRRHPQEHGVKEIFSANITAVEKRRLISLIRHKGNLESALRGQLIPRKRSLKLPEQPSDFLICAHCKGFYKRKSLILNKLELKSETLNKMLADELTEAVLENALILYFGEDLFKKTKNKRSTYHISNKLRECGRFLLEIQTLGPYSDMLSTLKPEKFDYVIEATKKLSKYDIENRNFGAPSLALHFGTPLKKLADLAEKLILRNKKPFHELDKEKYLIDLKRFKKLIENQWTTEIGSLAVKDLNEKAAIKPKLLPITKDIVDLKTFVEKMADDCCDKLTSNKSVELYKTLIEATLVLTILLNRKRVGDIQYLELTSYKQQISKTNNVP